MRKGNVVKRDYSPTEKKNCRSLKRDIFILTEIYRLLGLKWRRQFPRECRWIYTVLHRITPQTTNSSIYQNSHINGQRIQQAAEKGCSKVPTLTFNTKQFNMSCNFTIKYWPAFKQRCTHIILWSESIKLTFCLETWRLNNCLVTPLLST